MDSLAGRCSLCDCNVAARKRYVDMLDIQDRNLLDGWKKASEDLLEKSLMVATAAAACTEPSLGTQAWGDMHCKVH